MFSLASIVTNCLLIMGVLVNASPCPHLASRGLLFTVDFNPFYTNTMTDAQWSELRGDITRLLAWNPTPSQLLANTFPIGATIVRLSWHDAGTADVITATGGPHAATRFPQLLGYGENHGLEKAINALEPVYAKWNGTISRADLWSFAAAVFITNNGGPEIKWRPGRADAPSFTMDSIPDALLPGAEMTANEFRPIFYRMGFNDQEIVALLGAHTLGWAVNENSGYSGGWTTQPWWFSNQYFTRLLYVNTTYYEYNNNTSTLLQYNDPNGFMMLPADAQLYFDPDFLQYTELYAADQDAFFYDFALAFQKLQELNVASGLGPYVSTVNPNMINYIAGAPVLNEATVNLYHIYYGAWNDPTQTKTLETIANSISSTQWWSTVREYFGYSVGGKNVAISGKLQVASTYYDASYSAGKSFSGAQTSNYIRNLINAKRLPSDFQGIYVFFFSDDVLESSKFGTFCNQYCGYHDAFAPSTPADYGATYTYIVVGKPDQYCSGICDNPVMPNNGPTGDDPLDSTISLYTTMLARAVTNPAGVSSAWNDTYGREITDMCFYNYGNTSETMYGPFNLMVEGIPILVNALWDPVNQMCNSPNFVTSYALYLGGGGSNPAMQVYDLGPTPVALGLVVGLLLTALGTAILVTQGKAFKRSKLSSAGSEDRV